MGEGCLICVVLYWLFLFLVVGNIYFFSIILWLKNSWQTVHQCLYVCTTCNKVFLSLRDSVFFWFRHEIIFLLMLLRMLEFNLQWSKQFQDGYLWHMTPDSAYISHFSTCQHNYLFLVILLVVKFSSNWILASSNYNFYALLCPREIKKAIYIFCILRI